jgi:hypothetical protein
MVRPGPLSGGRCARAGLGAGAAQPGRPPGRRPAGRVCKHRLRVALGFRRHTPRPRASTRGRAERHRSGACPQQTRHPRPRPSPLGGPVHGSCPGPGAGKRRPGQVRRNNQRWRQLLWSQRVGRPGRCHRSAGRQSVAKPPAGGRGGLHPFGHSCPWGVRRCGVARGSVRRIVVNGKVVSIGHHYALPPCWPGNLALWLG